MKKCLFLVLLFPFSAAAQTSDPSGTLWYDEPAVQWTEALPIGNGRLGAMVFGGTARERIQFNEETVWTGFPHAYERKGAVAYLDRLRALLLAGKQEEAERIAQIHFMSVPLRQMSYQSFGDLRLTFPTIDSTDVSSYTRELRLSEGIVRTEFASGGVLYTRKVLSSHPDQVIARHLNADAGGEITFELRPTSRHRGTYLTSPGPDVLSLQGRVDMGAIEFEARVEVRVAGGDVATAGDAITVTGADEATILLAGATNFVSYNDVSADPVRRNERTLNAIEGSTWDEIRDRHLSDHAGLFSRVELDLGKSGSIRLQPTDDRILAFREGDDPDLAELLFQYGRYLLIASSRPGSQPANLQGIWNDSNQPPWESKWTVNINTEMNYWAAEAVNLAELTDPLFSMLEDVSESGRATAREMYGARGWVLHHNTDLWRGTAPINASDHGIWPTGGAWLSQHLWWHYEYGGDEEFLWNRAYPIMRGAALFFADYLFEDPRSGYLVSGPSASPENGGLVIGPTMDHQIIRELFGNVIAASEVLGVDSDLRERLRDLRGRIAPNRIGRLGQLQEWLEDIDDPENKHRHVSHLWGLHPGREITRRGTPDLFAAARKSLEYRGDGGTGWSLAWKINFWARLHDGDHAYRMLENLLTLTGSPRTEYNGGGVYANLFDAHPPFQIDGNFGATSGIVEMLVQDQTGEIELLPALPSAWPDGSVHGLRLRGGFDLDMEWRAGRLVEAVLMSRLGNTARVRSGNIVREYPTEIGQRVVLQSN